MTRTRLWAHLERLWVILGGYGADVPAPTLDPYESGVLAFELTALLPGPAEPMAPEIRLTEVWEPVRDDEFQLDEYQYEFVERPLGRRLAFHRHDVDRMLERFGVTVHEHCEEVVGRPACDHYFGMPVNAYEAVRAFTVMWGQPGPIGCDERRCMS